MHQQPDHWPAMPKGVSFALLEKPIVPAVYTHYYHNVGFTHNWLDRACHNWRSIKQKK